MRVKFFRNVGTNLATEMRENGLALPSDLPIEGKILDVDDAAASDLIVRGLVAAVDKSGKIVELAVAPKQEETPKPIEPAK